MRTAINGIRWAVRLIGIVMILLGVLFWTRTALGLIPLHMWLGFGLVLLIWVQAGFAARVGASWQLVAFAVVWGLVVPVFGMTQTQLLPGSFHWIIQVLHLLVGIVALGLADSLARRAEIALDATPQRPAAPITS
jgi:hypothetical protein